jgi:hypothetical protein
MRWLNKPEDALPVDINSKRVVHVAATYNPTQEWTAQQLRKVTPFAAKPTSRAAARSLLVSCIQNCSKKVQMPSAAKLGT